MKNLASITCALLIGFPSLAAAHEISKGTTEIGGGLDVSFSSADLDIDGGGEIDTDTTTITGDVLHYFRDNVGLGVTVSYESTEATAGGASAETTTTIFGPAISYNIDLESRASLKLLGALAIAEIEDQDSFSGSATADGYGFLFGGTLAYFISEHVSLDTSLRYTSISLEEDSFDVDYDLSGITLGLGLSVYIF